jgi:glycosyltransferase involved in cell wall biosynthesis
MKTTWLFVNGASVFGGHEVMLLRWIEELRRQGQVLPRVLSRAGSRLQERAGAAATSLSLPARRPAGGWRGRRAALLGVFSDIKSLLRVLAAEKPSLCVVAEGYLLSQPLFALVCRLAGVRVVIYVPLIERATHLGFRSGPVRDKVVRHGYAKVPHGWIVLTRTQADVFARWARVRRPIFELANTVAQHIETLANSPAETQRSHTAEACRVLVMGRLDMHQKGLDLLLEHLRQDSRARDVRVTLVGDGPASAELQHCIRTSPVLSDIVELSDWSDPVEAIRSHEVLLLASRFEGVPLVMLEAMALGLPVVSSDLPGTRAFLPATCLFPVGDLARALEIIATLRDPRERQRVIEMNRRTFAARASGQAFAAAVSDLTSKLSALPRARLQTGGA